MELKGWEGTGKLDVKKCVVPNFRYKVTERAFGKLSRNLRVLQRILVRLTESTSRCVVIK